MRKINKLAVVTGIVGFIGITAAQATVYNGDLFIGFSDGVGNDVLYDLGAPAAITNGASWNLSSFISSFTLSTVNWGVIGNTTNSGSSRLLYTTFDVAPATAGLGRASSINSDDTTMYQNNFPAAGAGQHTTVSPTDDNSWNRQTINPTLSTQYLNAWENPNTTGTTSFNLWKVQANSSAPVLLGAFSLASSGVLTFNTNSVTVTAPPPVPKIVSITRVGTTSTVFFTTTNGTFTYKLYYTNSTGLTAPVTNWASVVTTVVGNGLTNSIPDTTTDSSRFYRVGAH